RELRAGRVLDGCTARLRRSIPERVAAVEGRPHGSLQSREHRALVADTHFLFRRVDVDVDKLRVDADVDHRDGVAPTLQASLVALLQRVDERARAYGPAVDGEDHRIAAAAAEPRLAHHARDQWHADHLEHLRGHLAAEDGGEGSPPVAVAGAADSGAAVDGQVNSDVRV